MDLGPLASVIVLVLAGAALVPAGGRLARTAERLADRTGIGEALAGGLLLGAATSLPGIITTVSGSIDGNASFAISNATGGIAVQTAFIPLADLLYRRVNLEHAAASLPNVFNAVVLAALLSLVLATIVGPDLTVWRVHPVSVVILLTYLAATRAARTLHREPTWDAVQTEDTQREDEGEEVEDSLARLWGTFGALALVVAAAGWLIAQAGLSLVARTGLSSSVVGALFTGVITSMPELVTLIAAVRAGALALAIGDIVGGNLFDVLFLPLADLAYRGGSVYHQADAETLFNLALAIVLTCTLTAGLLLRQRRGIGFEGLTILVVYALGSVILATGAVGG